MSQAAENRNNFYMQILPELDILQVKVGLAAKEYHKIFGEWPTIYPLIEFYNSFYGEERRKDTIAPRCTELSQAIVRNVSLINKIWEIPIMSQQDRTKGYTRKILTEPGIEYLEAKKIELGI